MRLDEKFIHQLSAMFTCRDVKGVELSSRASKMLYKPPGAVYIASYYIDTSVLLENTPLVKLIRNCIRDLSGVIFHILTSEDIDDVISRFVTVVCANSQKWRAVRRAVDSLSSLKLT